jgi:hypothetical protein
MFHVSKSHPPIRRRRQLLPIYGPQPEAVLLWFTLGGCSTFLRGTERATIGWLFKLLVAGKMLLVGVSVPHLQC